MYIDSSFMMFSVSICVFFFLFAVLRSLNFKLTAFVCGVTNTVSNAFYIFKVQAYVEG